MDFGGGRRVSLGGGRPSKSKRALLEEARQRRAERAVASAPSRSAVVISRIARGLLQRRATARLLRQQLQMLMAAETMGTDAARYGDRAVRQLALLWACCGRTPEPGDAALIDAVCCRLDLAPGAVCVCATVAAAAWRRRYNSLVEPLLHVSVSVYSTAAVALLLRVCDVEAAMPSSPATETTATPTAAWERAGPRPCCPDRMAELQRGVAEGAAPQLISCLAALGPHKPIGEAKETDADEDPHALQRRAAVVAAVTRMVRQALRVTATASSAVPADSSLPDPMGTFVSTFWPPSIIARPPPAGRREGLRRLLQGWSAEATRRLELAIAQRLQRTQQPARLLKGGQRYDTAALILSTLRACVGGVACDWRPSGWAEGSPKVVSASEMQPLLQMQVDKLRETASDISSVDAIWLLVRHKWLPPAARADAQAAVEARAGITTDASIGLCSICFEQEQPLRSLRCGHRFCTGCWAQLLEVALDNGAGCTAASCPEPGCDEPISGEFWFGLLSADGARERLRKLVLRSFVDANRLLAWCPNAACGRAVALVAQGCPDARCECGSTFCAMCSEEPHFPALCTQRAKWQERLHQSPDAQFLLQHTRPCPSCGARTQRDKGCMHILCTHCSIEWCWACGQKGKGVHHAHECTRKPDPTWKFEAEERRLIDGSFSAQLDLWLYRSEQQDVLIERMPSANGPTQPTLPGVAAGEMLADLVAALQVLKWANVLECFSSGAPAGPSLQLVRRALAHLEACVDTLLRPVLEAVNGETALSPSTPLRHGDGERQAIHEWLVMCCLFLYTHAEQGTTRQ